jgi:predicted phage-related endonuclease
MIMQKHTDAPGSAGWASRRAASFNASDAPAMLGCHPNKTRTELLAEMHSGVSREFSGFVQDRVIDPGHRIEALARPIAELVLGDDLQVLGGSITIEGLSRPLGASFDGITFMHDCTWECKSMNDALRAALPHVGRDSAGKNKGTALPKDKRVQMEQGLMVSKAARALFTAAKFNAAGEVEEERHCWYSSDPALRAEILGGWKQFDADLAAYVPPAASAIEKLVAEPVEALPAPVIQVTGQIALVDNFKVFEERLRDFLATKLIREPKTDQDFVDLGLQITAMKDARKALNSAEAQMLAQVQPIDQAKKAKDMLDKLLQQNCSMAEKVLDTEKERRKGEIVAVGVKGLADHIAGLNTRLGKPYMPAIPADFGGAIKGLKSLASMEDKVATELARAKIAANEVADRIDLNLQALRELAAEHRGLFADTAQLVLKPVDDCRATITARISEHKAAVQKEADAAAERSREAIRKEEAARLAKEQQDKDAAAARQREADEALALQQREAAAPPPAATASPTPAPSPAPAPQVLAMPPRPAAQPAAAPAGPPTLTLGAIKGAINPLQIDAAGLEKLGFPPAATQGAAKLYHQRDLGRMLAAMVQHLEAVQAKQAA